MKKALIICREFLPYFYSFGGVSRVFNLARFLEDRGCETFILAAGGSIPISYFGYEKEAANLKATYIHDFLKDRSCTMYLQEHSERGHGCAIGVRNYSAKMIRPLKALLIPDEGVLFNKKYFRKACDLIRTNEIKNLIVSSPPHSVQLAGERIKNHFGNRVKYIVDYRDSWNTGHRRKQNLVFRYIEKRMEERILKRCDHFTYVSPPMIEKICNYFDVPIAEKSSLIMNGYDGSIADEIQDLSMGKKDDPRILSIGCFGEINTQTNPLRYLRILQSLMISGREYGYDIKVIFYGEIDNNIKDNIRTVLGQRAEFNGKLSHKDAVWKMRSMDSLLFTCNRFFGYEEIISGRLYDYMLAKRPIIVVGPENLEAGKMVKKERIGLFLNIEDDDEMYVETEKIIMNGTKVIPYNKDFDPSRYRRDKQFKRFLELLK